MKIAGWRKVKENNNLKVWENTHTHLVLHKRWNPVTARWQVYVTDGFIEIADYGRIKKEADAEELAIKIMKLHIRKRIKRGKDENQ